MTITQQLADLLAHPISDDDRQRAAVLLLDWTGCAVAGQVEAAGQTITAAFPNEIGNCTRIGAGKASPLMAALHNGCLGNVLEMDDVDRQAVLHAGPTVIPAALAMAEYIGASAGDFLSAIVVGYEATIRIGRAVGAGHYAFWHNTATCGPFGATAAACYLLKGSDLVSAFGLAGTQAAGLWQTRHEPDSMAKQLHAGHAAHAGVLAAILSKQGFHGPRTILEGEQGFFKAMCPGANPEDVLINYGDSWRIHETSLKPYPACRHTHPAIDAALEIRDVVNWQQANEIIIETYADAIKFCDNPNPQTIIEAKFSLQHSVAVSLIKGDLSLADFEIKNVSNEIIELCKIIKVKGVDEFTGAYPQHYGAAVKIAGTRYVARDAYGDPEVPMSDIDLGLKAISLMKHAGMTDEQAKNMSGNSLALAIEPSELTDYTDILP